jgi:hypothetical protein
MHITEDELTRRFNYHPPNTSNKVERHEEARSICRDAANDLVILTGAPSREQSLMVTHLEEAMFWANAALAREITGPIVDG